MPQDDPFPYYIEFRHVYKTFDRPVLVDSNFHVLPGETVAIIGRSGVGKSVTLGHMMGFLKPDQGRVIVAHEDITDFPESELRRVRKKVTMVFQSGALFDSMTVAENVLFSLELREDYDSKKTLSPGKLDRILDKQCGERPTVVVISACHSGVFIGKASKGDNRIWLTAARDDRVSFGCGAEFELTYFDECLLGAWPKSKTWKQLFDRTNTCVRLKESELSESSSLPQAFFGKSVKGLELP